MKKHITKDQFITAYRSAGLWFVVIYMEVFLLSINELRDDVLKTKIIEEIYNKGKNSDKDESGTRTRVNSLLRIIEGNRVIEALEVAIHSTRLSNDYPDGINLAKDLLKRIQTGEFIIPE